MKVLLVEDDPALAARIAIALNSAGESFEVLALNFEIPPGDALPTEMMLIPPGLRAVGRDGRAWNNRDPSSAERFFKARGLDIPIDIEHATELKAPKGEAAPAMAWIKGIKARADGSIWGTEIQWNPKGQDMVMNREYRYYSPAIIFDNSSMEIIGVKSVGLTNTPNFAVPALNRERQGGTPMELEQLLTALGLPAGTSFAAALNHIARMQSDHQVALNQAQNPPLDRFVPRADYDTALNRATAAEGSLKKIQEDTLELAINTEIDAALKAGKITPGTRDYHVAQCRQEGGLERFKAFVAAAPVVAPDSNLDGRQIDTGTALNAEEQKLCDQLGLSVEEYKKANNLK